MKKIITCCIAVASAIASLSQNNIGIGTSTPAASAALDISSTTKGLLTPRMTTTQRTAIASPAKGLLVYDTDLNALYHYTGTAWAAVGGSGGGFSLPYAGSIANAGDAFSITNTGTGTAISGTASANSVAAIEGNSSATVGGYGVLGNSSSASGFGIGGINATGTAVYGFSSGSGTALRGISTSGYSLLSSGNLRLTGGNTNPTAGAVLTSVDASGNAVWKPNKIAFLAINPRNEFITHGVYRKIEFDTEDYDFGGGFETFNGTTTDATSVFTAPVSGVYHFSSHVFMRIVTIAYNFDFAYIYLYKNGAEVTSAMGIVRNPSSNAYAECSINIDLHLTAGDKISTNVFQSNTGSLSATSYWSPNAYQSWFAGHLVVAD